LDAGKRRPQLISVLDGRAWTESVLTAENRTGPAPGDQRVPDARS
jgi:hypothetical protein